jgi:hypothetical protein
MFQASWLPLIELLSTRSPSSQGSHFLANTAGRRAGGLQKRHSLLLHLRLEKEGWGLQLGKSHKNLGQPV